MVRTLLILPDGSEIFSGAPGAAVVSARLDSRVNQGSELTLGAVIPRVLTCRLVETAGVQIHPGDPLQVYLSDGVRRRFLGTFYAGQPRYIGMGTMEFTARDALERLEQDISPWLSALEGWPYTLQELAQLTCQQCGLSLDDGDMLCGGIPLEKISGTGITGTKLLGWIAELAGCFVRMDGDMVRFAWFAPAKKMQINLTAGDGPVYRDGDLLLPDISGQFGDMALTLVGSDLEGEWAEENLTLSFPQTFFYYADSISRGATVQPVEGVLVRRNAADVGVTYPDRQPGANIYLCSGNALVSAVAEEYRQSVARELYERLSTLTYTACTLDVPASCPVMPGQTVVVDGRVMAVMSAKTEKGRTTLTCTGSSRRDTPEAIRDLHIKAESGRLFDLEITAAGLRAESRLTDERLTRLELDTEGLRSRVQRQETNENGIQTRLSQVEQTAAGLELSVKTVVNEGVDRVVTKSGYSFTDQGLIISKQGHQMENLLDHSGMYVRRGEDTILQANHLGVIATDVTVRNYLIVGEHARFEDYDTGTACFYI